MNDYILDELVERYNRGCGLASRVWFDDVRRQQERLGKTCRSLVYVRAGGPVYVRSKYDDKIVDVDLCARDFTHCSTFQLDNVQSCGELVGTREDISAVEFHKLPDFVQELCQNRVVHRVHVQRSVMVNGRVISLITVELARSFRPLGVLRIDELLLGAAEHSNQEREENAPPDVIAAWLISMTLMQHEHMDELTRRGDFLLSCYNNMRNGCMVVNVNYDTMFSGQGLKYRCLTWPFVLGLTTANNQHFDVSLLTKDTKEGKHLKNRRGTYDGQYGWRNGIAFVVAVSLLGALVTVVSTRAMDNWNTKEIITTLAVRSMVVYYVISVVNYLLLGNPVPWAMLKRDDRYPPRIDTLEQASRVLMSASCRRHFHGRDLSFTGEQYTGLRDFGYSFSHDDLHKMGFLRKCDGSGREYLVVPTSGAVLRVRVSSDGTIDRFTKVAVPPILYDKLWKSNNRLG